MSESPATQQTSQTHTRFALGCGGPSRLGTRPGYPHEVGDSPAAIIRRAIELGVTVFDTAESYGTEPVLGEVLGGLSVSERERLTVCTKKSVTTDHGESTERLLSAEEFAAGIEECRERLGVDRIDLFQLHAVTPDEYEHAAEVIWPVLQRAQAAGTIKQLGITEFFQGDTEHATLLRALADPRFAAGQPEGLAWIMIGGNILNQTAWQPGGVLQRASELGVNTLGMFAVRRALTNPARLHEVVTSLVESGEVESADFALESPEALLGTLSPDGTLPGLIAASYRFCLEQPGFDHVLSGTGSIAHLEANITSIAGGALHTEQERGWFGRMQQLFGRVTSATGH